MLEHNIKRHLYVIVESILLEAVGNTQRYYYLDSLRGFLCLRLSYMCY